MNQGSGNNSDSGRKREPIAHAVSEAAVSEIGVHQYRYTKIDLYKGRGYEAPMAGTDTHPCGSQGKH